MVNEKPCIAIFKWPELLGKKRLLKPPVLAHGGLLFLDKTGWKKASENHF
jgi:hypothetical protein